MLYKRGVRKTSQFTDKHRKQSSAGILSKDVLKNFAKLIKKPIFAGVPFLIKLQFRKLKLSGAATGDALQKFLFLFYSNVFYAILILMLLLKIFQFHKFSPQLKKTPTQMFSCEFFEVFKNTNLRTTARPTNACWECYQLHFA